MRIQERFDDLKHKNEAALILYYTAGFPTLKESLETIQQMADSGADIIEIGFPFSDPIADGATIQAASHAALEGGISLKRIMKGLKGFTVDCPLVVMSYLNPLLAYGLESLLSDFKETGITGLIIPDLPVEEAESIKQLCEKNSIDLIFLITPTSGEERIRLITEQCSGFVYCVSLTGITGERDALSKQVLPFVRQVKSNTKKPVAVGFGITTPEHIERLRDEVDGVIIGSRVIKASMDKENLNQLIRDFKEATRRS